MWRRDPEGLVRALGEGDDAAKTAAAQALYTLSMNNAANQVRIAKAGGIPALVALLRDGSANAKYEAAWALNNLAYCNDANQVLIAAAGAIVPLVELLRDGHATTKAGARWALHKLAHGNEANKVTIALAVGLEALVQLARRGRVTVDNQSLVQDAGVPAKRKAALIVAALLRACVPEELRGRTDIRDVIRGVIGAYL